MLMSPKQDETAVHGCHSTGTLLCACVKVRPDRGDVWCDHCIQMVLRICYVIGLEIIRINPFTSYRIRCGFIFFHFGERI